MNPQDQVIDLLRWMQTADLSTDRKSARAICPLTRRIGRVCDMSEHQRQSALPLPTIRDLARKGLRVRKKCMGALLVLKTDQFPVMGVGVGEEEAVLSLMNQARKRLLVA